MSMMIGSMNSNKRVIQIKKPDGSVAATISYSKKNQKKTKKLNYNFKSVSAQILLSKTPDSAGKAVTKARGVVASLLRKRNSGDYDDQDLDRAVIHARKMERIAKKRKKHLEQEEEIEQKGKTKEKEELLLNGSQEQAVEEEDLKAQEEELQELMQEYEELMQEAMERMAQEAMEQLMEEAQLEELSEEFSDAAHEMKPEDFEKLKKKHRSDEMREIADADMKYLRAVFNKLEKERQALSGGAKNFVNDMSGVSLEIAGLDMPVDMPELPPAAEGGNVDLMV